MVNLSKGEGINLSKASPGLSKVRIGLGWEASPLDLDASVFVCKMNSANEPKLVSDNHFIFYNNKSTPNGSVIHSGDNRTGDGDGDDETIKVDLSKLESEVAEISVIVTIHEALARGHNFGKLSSAYIRIYNDETGEAIAEYDLDANFGQETAVQFGSLVKTNGSWEFKAVGAGYKLDLGAFYAGYN